MPERYRGAHNFYAIFAIHRMGNIKRHRKSFPYRVARFVFAIWFSHSGIFFFSPRNGHSARLIVCENHRVFLSAAGASE